VALVGEGVRPLVCVPSALCRLSSFSLEARACVEEVAADGSACTPDSVCLESGVCVEGACLGAPRTCDDADACTTDACAEGRGCVHLPRTCPTPSRPCWVAVCDAQTGCGEAPAAAGTPCGEVSCEAAHICDGAGTCARIAPAPDGLPCGPATPCREAPTCQQGACAVPDAGLLQPLFAQPLPAEPEVVLRGQGGQVFASVCSEGEDAGCSLHSFTGLVRGAQVGLIARYGAPVPLPDAARLVSVSPHGVLVREEGALHAFHRDSGAALWRFAPEELLACTPEAPGGWHAHTAADRIATGEAGGVLATFGWREGPRTGNSVWGAQATGEDVEEDVDAGTSDGGEVDAGLPDGGEACEPPLPPPLDEATQTLVVLGPDGSLQGALDVSELGADSLLALAADGAPLLFTPDGTLARAALAGDGGPLELQQVLDAGAGPRTLVVDAVRAVAGTTLLPLQADAGVPRALVSQVDGGVLGEGAVLLGARLVYRVEEVCAAEADAGACAPATRLAAFSAEDGAPEWTLELLPADIGGRALETALLRLGNQEGVGVVSVAGEGAGVQGALQLVAEGQLAEVCLLEPQVQPLQALFEGGALYLVVQREGRYRLEAYDLKGLQATEGAWPQAAGVSGTRRGR
jgi:hypothetical protein